MAINRNWEDDFNEDDFDDYKSAEVERERLRQENSTEWWIYIGVDTERDHEAKIGLTSGKLGTRASSAQNPRYTLIFAFKVKHGIGEPKLKEIEGAVIAMLETYYQRLRHRTTGRKTEWFVVNAHEMREVVHNFLYEHYSYYMNCYYCHEREIGVILSWQNDDLIHRRAISPYHARDLSNPPVSFECLTPPGCGANCDCW